MWRLIRQQRTGRASRRAERADAGVAATIVALLLGSGVLMGMAALTVDVAMLYTERRQVQNGSDAVALAVAVACAKNPNSCDTSASGQNAALAGRNANDGATAVNYICGSGHPSLGGCPGSAGPTLTQCPAPPSGVRGWVQVGTQTRTASGGSLLPPAFARALAGNTGYPGSTVLSCAQAAWGSPGSATVIPLTISACEWDAATNGGLSFAPPPPYPPYPAASEVALKLHTTAKSMPCPGGTKSYGDIPGGFGWLDSAKGCDATLLAGAIVGADPGLGNNACTDIVTAKVGSVIFIPVYDSVSGSGSKADYRVMGFAAFYLSGYHLPGASPGSVNSPVGGALCKGDDKCVYGWFTQAIIPAGPIGPGPDLGARVVALTG